MAISPVSTSPTYEPNSMSTPDASLDPNGELAKELVLGFFAEPEAGDILKDD